MPMEKKSSEQTLALLKQQLQQMLEKKRQEQTSTSQSTKSSTDSEQSLPPEKPDEKTSLPKPEEIPKIDEAKSMLQLEMEENIKQINEVIRELQETIETIRSRQSELNNKLDERVKSEEEILLLYVQEIKDILDAKDQLIENYFKEANVVIMEAYKIPKERVIPKLIRLVEFAMKQLDDRTGNRKVLEYLEKILTFKRQEND